LGESDAADEPLVLLAFADAPSPVADSPFDSLFEERA
jgi:hypothetical protein